MNRFGKRLLILFSLICLSVLISFILYGESLVNKPIEKLTRADTAAGILSAGLLALDVYLPIPSSVVMTLNGKLFGWTGGFWISLIGNLLGGCVAFATGRLIRPWELKGLPPRERAPAEEMLKRNGLWILALSRPIPIMAEAIAITAAAGGMPMRQFLIAILLGSLPLSAAYAAAGAFATDLRAGTISLLGVLVISGVCWKAGRRFAA